MNDDNFQLTEVESEMAELITHCVDSHMDGEHEVIVVKGKHKTTGEYKTFIGCVVDEESDSSDEDGGSFFFIPLGLAISKEEADQYIYPFDLDDDEFDFDASESELIDYTPTPIKRRSLWVKFTNLFSRGNS